VRRNKLSGDHFRRRYQTAQWEAFAATRPSSQSTLGRHVSHVTERDVTYIILFLYLLALIETTEL